MNTSTASTTTAVAESKMVDQCENQTDCNMPQGSCWSTVYSGFYLFLARHSGRRRIESEGTVLVRRQGGGGGSSQSLHRAATFTMLNFLLLVSVCLSSTTHACSSRSTPKPRPLQPTARPNVTFHTYPCPPVYATWYCLNDATCFAIKIGESLLYNCECPDGYMGQRCEYKNLDGSYTTTRRQVMLESASIASGVSVAVLLVFIICTTFYIRSKRQRKLKMNATDISMVDGTWGDMERRPFAYRPKHTIVTIPLKTVITESVTRPVDGPEGSSRQEPLIV
ncbi:pro-neuregulin-3, membrane-bound isoform-like isoform X1 [Daktulosphaira vitifoliae]|uniref:pro-neuregulin-3, membrane-bound isoform-like isoform X1 n=1 Tax=Daktulosphaira vitifoliae TaxID=58002 RepID=UPI0021AA0335|nr:pro-neuregulin-3, membrane-bound isoform-like isoform X1 [Daktulosphaira vitifoliae]